MDQRETVDVLIVGSGPAGATYARTIGVTASGPGVDGRGRTGRPRFPGGHTQNMTDEERAAAQLLTQGPDAGVVRAAALSDIAPGIDPSLEFRQTILPGLFFVDPRPRWSRARSVCPPRAWRAASAGWGSTGAPPAPPEQSERIPFLDAGELDSALAEAEELLGTTTFAVPGRGLPEALRAAVAEVLDGPGLNSTGFMPTSTRWEDGSLRFAGTGAILGELRAGLPPSSCAPRRSPSASWSRTVWPSGRCCTTAGRTPPTRCAPSTSWCAPTDCVRRRCCSPPASARRLWVTT